MGTYRVTYRDNYRDTNTMFPLVLQEDLKVVPALLAMLDSPVAALRAKALVSFALLTQTHPALLLDAFQAKLSPQVAYPGHICLP